MAAISSTVGFQAATQAAFQQLKLQQARQNAERAEQAARSLQSQAVEAQRVADRAQEDARSLSVQSSQAQRAAGQAKQGLAMIQSVDEMKASLSSTLTQVSERQESVRSSPAPSVSAPAKESPPVVNLSGQVTGTVVNTTA